jgi:hypothetical protein
MLLESRGYLERETQPGYRLFSGMSAAPSGKPAAYVVYVT